MLKNTHYNNQGVNIFRALFLGWSGGAFTGTSWGEDPMSSPLHEEGFCFIKKKNKKIITNFYI
jgi:hypothetical protein